MPAGKARTPAHFSALWLRNFRGFKNTDRISLAPLTFLVGPNSSGKSSLFDALLLLTQSHLWPIDVPDLRPSWAGPLVDLGSFSDAVYRHNSRLTIEISFEFSIPTGALFRSPRKRKATAREQPISLSLALKTRNEDPIGALATARIRDTLSAEEVTFHFGKSEITLDFLDKRRQRAIGPSLVSRPLSYWVVGEISPYTKAKGGLPISRRSGLRRILTFIASYDAVLFMSEAQRVSSGRAAPRRWYPLSDTRLPPIRGYFQPRIFDTVDPAMFHESTSEDFLYPFQRRRYRPPTTIEDLLTDLEIASTIQDARLSPYHSSIQVKDSVTGVHSNLIDVGYGASQVIPILYACLSGAIGPLFIEQPEIHLHPKAQGTVADLLCQTSRNRQVVVETHSVHMINRARIQVAKGELPHSHVIINYISRTKSGSRVKQIPLLPNGEFAEEWPGGFFDERYEDTMVLLRLKGRRR